MSQRRGQGYPNSLNCWEELPRCAEGPVLRKRNRESSTVSNPTFECTQISVKTLPSTLEFPLRLFLGLISLPFGHSQFSSIFLPSLLFSSILFFLPSCASPRQFPCSLLAYLCMSVSTDLLPISFMRDHQCPQHCPSFGGDAHPVYRPCEHSTSFQ